MSNSQSTGMNKLLLIVTIVLMCAGIAVIYSASAPVAASRNLPAEYYLKAHLHKFFAALVAIFFFYKVDYALWKVAARFIFVIGAILTLAAIVSGGEVKGASRWIWGSKLLSPILVLMNQRLEAGTAICILATLQHAG